MQGRTVFITGAAQGLGAAHAAHLAGLGARVVVADINAAGARDVAAAIGERGGEALALNIDVTDEQAVEAAFAEAAARFGAIDVLINNAGGQFGWSAAEDFTLEEWNRTVALSLTSAWLCSRAAIPALKAARSGRIINVVSATADRGIAGNMAAYIAAKGGVVTLTRALARELGPHMVTVNAISPGLFVMDKGEAVQALAEGVMQDQCIPRLGVPDDIVGAVAFLASDASSFITGQVLNVDGGWSLK